MGARISRSLVAASAIVALVGGGVLLLRGTGAPNDEPPPRLAADADPAAEPGLAAPSALGVPPLPVGGAGRSTVVGPPRPRPREGRRVEVHVETGHPASPSGTLVWFQGHPETEAAPDAAGQLEVSAPDGASLLVGRLADGHWARTTVPSDALRAELVFASEISLAGTVRGPDGAPRAGFRLRVDGIGARDPTRRDPALRDYDRRAEVVETTTGPDGTFEVRGLESKYATIVCADPAFRLLTPLGEQATKVPSSALVLVADRVRVLSFRCVDADTEFPIDCQATVARWPPGYSAGLLAEWFPQQRVKRIPWPADAAQSDPPVIELLPPGYRPRTERLDVTHAEADGITTLRFQRDGSPVRVGAIFIDAPESLELGPLPTIDLIDPKAPTHVTHVFPQEVRGRRYLIGVAVGEHRVRVLGRVLSTTVVVRAGETTTITVDGPSPPPVSLRPRLGANGIGGPVLVQLTLMKEHMTTSTRLDVTSAGTLPLGVLAPGAYRVELARDTDAGIATFSVPDAGGSSEPIVVDVPMVARSALGDGSK